MCLTVDYYCICGVAARTEQVPCSASLALPLPPRFDETHQLRQLSMVLPRDEWDVRQGVCPQEACPQNSTSTGTVSLKCPGCSTICSGSEPQLDGDKRVYSFDDLLGEQLDKDLERELSRMESYGGVDESNASDESKDDFGKELERELEKELENIDFDVNKAEFLHRSLWQTYDCPVEFCPLNKDSMAQANKKLAADIADMKREAENPVQWSKEDDDQILDLSSHNADCELIAAVMRREVIDVDERSAYLRLLSELLK